MADDATSPRSPSLRRRFALWFGLLFVLGAVLTRVAYYQATVATLERDLDELLWSRLGMVRVLDRFEPRLSLGDQFDADGRYLRRPADGADAGSWFGMRRPQVDPGGLSWFAGVWNGDGKLVDGVAWPADLGFDAVWRERADTLWTTADRRYRLGAAAGGGDTVILVGSDREALAAATRDIAWFEVRSLLVWVPLVLGAAWLLLSKLLMPLAGIAATARRIRGGHFEERIDLARTDAEFQELAGTINEMLDRLDAIRISQSRFNADLAHQLMNPVHAILLETDNATGQPRSSADLAAALARVGGLARRIDSICEVLLAYSRSATLDATRLQPVDVEPIVAAAIDRVKPQATALGIAIESPAGGAVVNGDGALLEEVFVNLLSNAVDHSTAGGRIEVLVDDGAAACRVAVVDHGAGVADDELPRIFARFHSGTPGGHGIGLALSRLIARSHGGDVDHEPTPGGGATFSLRLPRPA